MDVDGGAADGGAKAAACAPGAARAMGLDADTGAPLAHSGAVYEVQQEQRDVRPPWGALEDASSPYAVTQKPTRVQNLQRDFV